MFWQEPDACDEGTDSYGGAAFESGESRVGFRKGRLFRGYPNLSDGNCDALFDCVCRLVFVHLHDIRYAVDMIAWSVRKEKEERKIE